MMDRTEIEFHSFTQRWIREDSARQAEALERQADALELISRAQSAIAIATLRQAMASGSMSTEEYNDSLRMIAQIAEND